MTADPLRVAGDLCLSIFLRVHPICPTAATVPANTADLTTALQSCTSFHFVKRLTLSDFIGNHIAVLFWA